MSSGIPEKADRGNAPRNKVTVSVFGFDKKDVLFKSDDANAVVVCGASGEPSMMLVRITGNKWGFSMRGDDDWEENLSLFWSRGDE